MKAQYHIINDTQMRLNQKIIMNENHGIQTNPHRKTEKKKIIEKPNIDVECPSYKNCKWVEINK